MDLPSAILNRDVGLNFDSNFIQMLYVIAS